jgi:hypothetical protein
MVRRKKAKGKVMIYKTLHKKWISSNTNHTKKLEWTQLLRNCKQFLLHNLFDLFQDYLNLFIKKNLIIISSV